MKIRQQILSITSLFLVSATSFAQGVGVSPQDLLKPLANSWPTYNGDYSGKRYSALTAVNRQTVKNLGLAWFSKLTPGDGALGSVDNTSNAPVNLTIGGEGPGNINIRSGSIKGSVLAVDETLYVTMPDNAWALDARDGHQLWHYFWKTKGGTHIGNRGFGMWNNYLYMETPDDYLVSLDAKTGKERWHRMIASVDQGYFATPAPIVIGNHVLVGVGNDIDSPGFLQSYDAETGELQWKFYTVPMKKDDPGADTWASLDAAQHGGAQTWITGAYDPETHLYIFGTGNPTPAYTTGIRGDKDNLFTCTLIALNVDTGKMAWYFQTSPHDMHDYDSAQTPVLFDGMFKGKMRKLVATAARNGYYFTLDRVTGEHLVTSRYGLTTNWAKGLTPAGGPQHDPAKDATIAGSLGSPNSSGTINWQPVAFSPLTNLLYAYETDTFALLYLTDPDPRGSMGLGGKEEVPVGTVGSYLTAIDYRTGKARWRHRFYSSNIGGGGLLTTAGGLLFSGDGSNNLVAYDAMDGRSIWNARIGQITNAPQTFELDGHQYVICASGDTLWSFVLH
ncbi:acido-empty-quinoprotein group A [Edaphobacter modestus]|uniref:Alcohol dehydrogenase (Cytochrome c) n=1 Tax=Edaphobacter modestus TaxID=388466 RepID=A0A4Q7YNA2_9BACT|nr:acido-empty-quinoprotein group A [Edaphobacter modestus]RZU39097.1 alcohol dehydrogenase (cytochrome c) [Edaphobacter modestus]